MRLVIIMTLFFIALPGLTCPILDVINKKGETVESICYRSTDNTSQRDSIQSNHILVIVSATWCAPCDKLRKFLLTNISEIEKKSLQVHYTFTDSWGNSKASILKKVNETNPAVFKFLVGREVRRLTPVLSKDVKGLKQDGFNSSSISDIRALPTIMLFDENRELTFGLTGASESQLKSLLNRIEKIPNR